MSIVIVTCTEKCVAICSDCQHTNMRTGLSEDVGLKKIEEMSPALFVAHCGSAAMGELCMRVARKLYADEQISKSSVEEMANILKKAYEYGIKAHPDIEERCTSKFIVAGKLISNRFGFIVIETEAGVVKTEIFNSPTTKVYGPKDVSSKECASILDILAVTEDKTSVPEYIEHVCRKTVEAVSVKSKYVSKESLFSIYSDY